MKYVTIGPADGKPGEVYYPLELRDAPVPTVQRSEVLIKVTAAALNHRDFFIRQHLYPGTTLGTPLLSDGAGTVVAVGEDASSDWLHKRVVINPGTGWKESPTGPEGRSGWYSLLGGTKYYKKGTLTEYLTMHEDNIVQIPDHLSDIEAAALPVTGLTAWRALVTKAGKANTGNGSNILITGIGGGVALMALQFAVAGGANVWVTSSSGDKIRRAVQMGARGGVSYRDADWADQLLASLPQSRPFFDCIIDGAGGDIIEKATLILKAGSVLVVYGMTIAPKMDFLMKGVLRNIEVKGSTMGSLKEFKEMIKFIEQNGIHPVVSKVVEGIQNMAAIEGLFQDIKKGSQFGKLVIKISETRDSKL